MRQPLIILLSYRVAACFRCALPVVLVEVSAGVATTNHGILTVLTQNDLCGCARETAELMNGKCGHVVIVTYPKYTKF